MGVGNELNLAAVDAARVVDPVEDCIHTGLDVDATIRDGSRQIHAGAIDNFILRNSGLRPGREAPAHDQCAHEDSQHSAVAEKSLHPVPPSYCPGSTPRMPDGSG